MALTLGDNFSYQGAKPLDARLKYDTLAAMKAVADSTMYDGCLAYCVATDKTYQWKSTNTVDPDTGKWSEYSSGGGHEIKNNGVAVTERGVMNFTDFDIADDSTNEETDVKVHRLTSAEFSDICTPLPGAISDMPIVFDETGTERIVGEYKYANGTKKPVYEKCVVDSMPTTTEKVKASKTIFTDANVDQFIKMQGYMLYGTNVSMTFPLVFGGASDYPDIGGRLHTTNSPSPSVTVQSWTESYNDKPVYVTIQYTKSTDIPS